MSKRFALLVGMTAYQDDRLEATTTSKDIRALVERLRDPENGRFDRVVPLLNQTALELQLGIASFFEQAMEPEDLVFFYFAGHSLIHHQNIYLATTDTFTEEYLDATTVEIDFVRRRLNATPAQQVVVLDNNFSFIGATDRHTNSFEMLAKAFSADYRAVLISTSLTGLLIDGLEGVADKDKDGIITFAELGAYVQKNSPEAESPTIATNATVDNLPISFCTAEKTVVPIIIPPPVIETPEESDTPPATSKKQRYGIIALVLLLLLMAFGLYAANIGMFSGSPTIEVEPDPSPTTAVAAILSKTSETPSPTPTTQAEETAVLTPTPSRTVTAVIDETATTEATSTATPKATVQTPTTTATRASATPTATPTAKSTATDEPPSTKEPTATTPPTSAATSEPVPMDVVAQQAFLRAGPGINYRILDFPSQGTAVTVLARNGDGTWYNVLLADDTNGWLHRDVLAADDEDAFDTITIAETIPAPIDEFFDPIITPSGESLSVQVYHTYVGTQGDNVQLKARLLPETSLVQPTYLSGQELGLGLHIVEFNRVSDGAYTSDQVEFCMVSDTGEPFYCKTFWVRKSW